MADLYFYYDIVCPYAYLASRRVEAMAERTGATLEWCPVLLGGLLAWAWASWGRGLVRTSTALRP